MTSALFLTPEDAATLYFGQVMHQRMGKITHRFTYTMLSLVIDVQNLDAAKQQSWLFSINKPNIFAFHESDHLERAPNVPTNTALYDEITALLTTTNVTITNPKILLMCYPRMFGYVFNPISIYFCYDVQNNLCALIYEVRNTFGDCHRYVMPLGTNDFDARGVRQECDKVFYVSPFMDMAQRYHFRVRPPTPAQLSLRILETSCGKPTLAATFVGTGTKLSTRALLYALFALPFATLKVMLGIHFEAARLWLKGVNFYHRPKKKRGTSLGSDMLDLTSVQPISSPSIKE